MVFINNPNQLDMFRAMISYNILFQAVSLDWQLVVY